MRNADTRVPIVIMGGLGDGLVALDCLRQLAALDPCVYAAGFLNDALPKGSLLAGLPVLGPLEAWRDLSPEHRFVPALHKLKAMPQRSARLQGLGVPLERWTSLIHPTVVLAADVLVGTGSYLGAHVVVQTGAVLGTFLSLRAGASVGHDATLGNYAYMGPNSVLCGRAALEQGAHLGPCAVVNDNVHVGAFCVVGAASSVSRDVAPYALAMGNPARVVEHLPHAPAVPTSGAQPAEEDA